MRSVLKTCQLELKIKGPVFVNLLRIAVMSIR